MSTNIATIKDLAEEAGSNIRTIIKWRDTHLGKPTADSARPNGKYLPSMEDACNALARISSIIQSGTVDSKAVKEIKKAATSAMDNFKPNYNVYAGGFGEHESDPEEFKKLKEQGITPDTIALGQAYNSLETLLEEIEALEAFYQVYILYHNRVDENGNPIFDQVSHHKTEVEAQEALAAAVAATGNNESEYRIEMRELADDEY